MGRLASWLLRHSLLSFLIPHYVECCPFHHLVTAVMLTYKFPLSHMYWGIFLTIILVPACCIEHRPTTQHHAWQEYCIKVSCISDLLRRARDSSVAEFFFSSLFIFCRRFITLFCSFPRKESTTMLVAFQSISSNSHSDINSQDSE